MARPGYAGRVARKLTRADMNKHYTFVRSYLTTNIQFYDDIGEGWLLTCAIFIIRSLDHGFQKKRKKSAKNTAESSRDEEYYMYNNTGSTGGRPSSHYWWLPRNQHTREHSSQHAKKKAPRGRNHHGSQSCEARASVLHCLPLGGPCSESSSEWS